MGKTWRREDDCEFNGGKRKGKKNFERKNRWEASEQEARPERKQERKQEHEYIFS